MAEYLKLMFIDLRGGVGFIVTVAAYAAGIVLLMDFRPRGLRKIPVCLAEMFLLIGIDLMAEGIWHGLTGSIFSKTGWVASIAVYACFFCRYRYETKIAMSVTYFSVFYLTTAFGGYAAEFLRYYGFWIAGSRYSIDFTCIAVVLIFAVLVVYLKKYSTENLRFIPISGLVMCVCSSMISVVTQPVYQTLYTGFEDISGHYNALVSLILIFSDLLAYRMFYSMANEYTEKLALAVTAQKATSDKSILDITEKNLRDMRALRHELKNQMAYAGGLLEQGDYDRLKVFFEETTLGFSSVIPSAFCGNPVLDNILAYEDHRIKSAGGALNAQLLVPPALPVPDGELCSLFMNLLDNASEGACASGREKPVIELKVYTKGDYLFITVTNPVKEVENPQNYLKLHTTKKEKLHHGYGTVLIRGIVEKYSGSVRFEIRDGRFIVNAMMLMEGL